MRWVSVILGLAVFLAACGSSVEDAGLDVVEDGDSEAVITATDESVDADQGSADTAIDGEADAEESGVDQEEAGAVLEVPRRDPSVPFGDGLEYDADATVFVVPAGPIEAGSYRTSALGTPISFTADEPLMVQVNYEGAFVVTDVSSRAPDDRDLEFLRLEGFSDPAAPNAPFGEQELWPADDFIGWLDNLNDFVVASEPVETTVNGMDAITVDLELAEGVECGFLPGKCVGFAVYDRFDARSLNVGAQSRVWIVEQGDEAPLLIVAGIARAEDVSWFARAESLLDTLAFGDVAPHPVRHIEPEGTEVVALGGIEVLPSPALQDFMDGPYGVSVYDRFAGRGFSWSSLSNHPGVVFFAEELYDLEGARVTAADEVVQILTEAGSEITELDPITIGGVPTRVFSQSSDNVWDIPFAYSPLDIGEPKLGWDTPATSTIWLIDHPERGLMLMSAMVWEDDEETRRLADLLGTAFAESMTFS